MTWELNYIMGLMKCKLLQLLLTKVILKKMCVTLLYLCPKLPLLAAILRQQHVKKIIKNKYNNHNNTILYGNILYLLRSTELSFCQITNLHQQVQHIP